MIADCPHCFTRALLAVDQPCPTCRKIVSQELLDLYAGLNTITVDEGTAVPDYCFLCDRPRTKVLKVRIAARSGTLSITDARSTSEECSVAGWTLLRFVLGLAIGKILVGKFNEDPGMRVYVPTCEPCESRLHICHVNSRERSITLLANANFGERVRQCRTSRSKKRS